MASRTIIKTVTDFAKLVSESGLSLKKVILFGSYSQNKQTPNSDIDVALVADEFSGIPSDDIKLFIKAMRKYYLVQPQTYNTKDFSSAKDPFVEEILRTGIEIKI